MLYGQLDAVYKNLNPDARYIGMQGSIRIPSLNGELVNISTQKSDLYKNIFNGSNIDNLKKDNLTGSIEISNSPDNGLWKTGIMNLTQAGFIGDWTAAFNDNGSVTIGPDNITVFLWQKTLEPIK
jgi:hypothetical protein